MHIELADCERTLLMEINDKAFTRNDVALTYAMTLLSSEMKSVDWRKVNQAIIERWSMSGLDYIKTRAWRMAEGRLPMKGSKRVQKLLAEAGVD